METAKPTSLAGTTTPRKNVVDNSTTVVAEEMTIDSMTNNHAWHAVKENHKLKRRHQKDLSSLSLSLSQMIIESVSYRLRLVNAVIRNLDGTMTVKTAFVRYLLMVVAVAIKTISLLWRIVNSVVEMFKTHAPCHLYMEGVKRTSLDGGMINGPMNVLNLAIVDVVETTITFIQKMNVERTAREDSRNQQEHVHQKNVFHQKSVSTL